MQQRLKKIQHTFVLSIVLLATVSVMAMSAVLFATNAVELRHTVSANHLFSLTQDYPELTAYIETQKAAAPHFVKIANLVKADQQQLLGTALLYTVVPVLLVSGLIAFWLARRLLQPVEETFSSQERFLQDAGHELRNPLAAVSAVIQEARANPKPEAREKALEVLDRQVAQLVKLNEDLLLLERTKHRSNEQQICNASELIIDVLESVTSRAAKQKVLLKPFVKKDVWLAIPDRDFVCVARNLIENAIKYSPAGGMVTIRLSVDKHVVVMSVADKGIGIPPEQLEHIGERFYRANNVGRTPGTGLGMAIVQQIVSNAKGEVKLQSTEGKGTTVTVELPLAKRA